MTLFRRFLGLATDHQRGDVMRQRVALLAQRRDDALAVRRAAVLAELVLALEPGHRNDEADDAADHALDILGGLVGESPGGLAAALVDLAERADQAGQRRPLPHPPRPALRLGRRQAPGLPRPAPPRAAPPHTN